MTTARQIRAVFVSLGVLCVVNACAQDEPASTKTVVSPEVRSDGTLTVRLHAPYAHRVRVTGDWDYWKDRKILTKAEDGTWSTTIGPLPAAIYQYVFLLDGVRMPDPGNPWVATSPVWGKQSLA